MERFDEYFNVDTEYRRTFHTQVSAGLRAVQLKMKFP